MLRLLAGHRAWRSLLVQQHRPLGDVAATMPQASARKPSTPYLRYFFGAVVVGGAGAALLASSSSSPPTSYSLRMALMIPTRLARDAYTAAVTMSGEWWPLNGHEAPPQRLVPVCHAPACVERAGPLMCLIPPCGCLLP